MTQYNRITPKALLRRTTTTLILFWSMSFSCFRSEGPRCRFKANRCHQDDEFSERFSSEKKERSSLLTGSKLCSNFEKLLTEEKHFFIFLIHLLLLSKIIVFSPSMLCKTCCYRKIITLVKCITTPPYSIHTTAIYQKIKHFYLLIKESHSVLFIHL